MYKCKFPGCNFESANIGSLDNHHIIPKCKNGSDKGFNRILLCPNCHRKIYIENIENGIHSIVRPESIVILNKFQSTVGDVLHYRRCDTNKEFYWWYATLEETSV